MEIKTNIYNYLVKNWINMFKKITLYTHTHIHSVSRIFQLDNLKIEVQSV